MSQENQETNQQTNQITYNEKYGFFEFPDGLKLPAVAIFYRYAKLYSDFVDIQLLYSLKTDNFIPFVTRDYEEEDSDEKYPYNTRLIYNLRLGQYVLFEVKNVKDFLVRIDTSLIDIYADNVNDLLEYQDRLSYKFLDSANAVIYYPQIDNVRRQEHLTEFLINLSFDIMKKIEANGEYKLEVPRLHYTNGYNWKELKQMVLKLRQPLDPNA